MPVAALGSWRAPARSLATTGCGTPFAWHKSPKASASHIMSSGSASLESQDVLPFPAMSCVCGCCLGCLRPWLGQLLIEHSDFLADVGDARHAGVSDGRAVGDLRPPNSGLGRSEQSGWSHTSLLDKAHHVMVHSPGRTSSLPQKGGT